jgi:multicomponent Na+:H+ antiporter subunit D
MALGQNDFKRMLAYSSISQIGYMLLGLGAGTPLGVAGSVFHLFNHAIFKTLLFVNSAVLEKQLGTRDMRKLGGLGKSMPVTALSATLASLSAAGLPPLAGFWSKLLIIIALWLSGHYIYAGLASVAGVLTLGYFLMMQRKVFFGKPRQDLANAHEANSSFSVIQIILALITLGAGLAFPFMLNNFILPLEAIVGKG